MRMDLDDLRVFARIADLLSVSAAARSLERPKSSVSRSLTRLEAGLGSVLVDRSTRHLRLTDAGTLLLPHARRVIGDVEEAVTALGNYVGAPRGTLRVNVPFTFAVGLLAPMLPGFMARYPEVRVVLDVENRVIDLPVEAADLVIRVGPLPDSDLVARRLARIELWTCASPAYLAARGTPSSVEELPGHTLLAAFDRPMTWSYRWAGGRTGQVEVRPGSVVPEPTAMRTVLLAGAGIGRLPDFLAEDPVAAGTLVRLLPDSAGDAVEIHALYPSHRSLSAKVRVFLETLVEHLDRVRPRGAPPPALDSALDATAGHARDAPASRPPSPDVGPPEGGPGPVIRPGADPPAVRIEGPGDPAPEVSGLVRRLPGAS